MKKLTVEDLDLQGKKVLMRVDFNVPLEKGKVANDTRIRAALPTIKYITEKGGRLILMSHLGRPDGKRVPEMSLTPCTDVLKNMLGKNVAFVDDAFTKRKQPMIPPLPSSLLPLATCMSMMPSEPLIALMLQPKG